MVKQRKRYGEMWADFAPHNLINHFFKVSRGEENFLPAHNYPIIEMIRSVKLAFDQHRLELPRGRPEALEDRLLEMLAFAGAIELENTSTQLTLNELRAANDISEDAFFRHSQKREDIYHSRVREVAAKAAEDMQTIELLAKKRISI